MSIDVDTLAEVYKVMKEYVASKDRQAVADHVCSVVADFGISERELKEFCGEDSYLGRAIRDYLCEEEETDEDDSE